MIVTVSSVRGAPGVSSWSLLLAAAWPSADGHAHVVVEADVDGGVAGARYGVGSSPGVAQLLSSLRGGADAPDDIGPFARNLGDGGWLIPGPEGAEESRSVWSSPGNAANAANALAADPRLWMFDVGRAGSDGPLSPVLRSSSVVVLMAHGDHASVVQLPARVEALRSDGCRLVVVGIVGSSPFAADEISSFSGAPVVDLPADGQLPVLAGAVWTRRRVRRSSTWRRAVAVASAIAELATADHTTSVPTEVSGAS